VSFGLYGPEFESTGYGAPGNEYLPLKPPSGPNSFNGYNVFAKVFVDINVSGESITLLTVKFVS
jgi:hypothetical protein